MVLIRKISSDWLRYLVHFGAFLPLMLLIWDYSQDRLSVNPIQDITFRTGKCALILLLLSLACTPVNSLFGFRPALRLRRALGLYAFMYVALHFLTFIGLDYGFDFSLIRGAVFEKRYALVGFSAFLILLPLAITSTKGWMRRLGKRWKRLHRGVYVAGLLAVLHYMWVMKSDIRQPLLYGAIVGVLLLMRVPSLRKGISHYRGRLKGFVIQTSDRLHAEWVYRR